MKMPHAESAVVPSLKITEYLLSRTHPRGSMKSVWLESLGFEIDKPDNLAEALLAHAEHDVQDVEQTPYGTKYCIVGELIGPERASLACSIWIVLEQTDTPRLVTAYPKK